jgi:glycosyltransferase involved in cell wall biosynthesis
VPWKNHIVFLRAAEHTARDLPYARFVFVGDDIFGRDWAYKHSVLRYAESSPIAERVEFWGWQPNMDEVWAKINCLVHTAEREPFGRVIIEAMAHRVPVLAANCSGPSEIIQDYRTGILVPGNNVERLSEAMLHVARDSQFAHRMANAAYNHVLSTFTADKTAEQTQEIYRELLCE